MNKIFKYKESFKRQVVVEIESGKLRIIDARRKYEINGNMTISRWRKKYGTCASEKQKEVQPMKQRKQETNKPENKPDGKDRRIEELEDELILLRGLIENSEYFRKPEVKKKIIQGLSTYYETHTINPEVSDIPLVKSVLYSILQDKATTGGNEQRQKEKNRKK